MALRYKPEHNKLYKDKRWPSLRERVFLRDNYTCQWHGCGKLLIGKGRGNPDAPVAHHKVDHKGDMRLFLDEQNIISVCKACHDRDAQKATHRGYVTGHDEDGRPIDPNHPWNRRTA